MEEVIADAAEAAVAYAAARPPSRMRDRVWRFWSSPRTGVVLGGAICLVRSLAFLWGPDARTLGEIEQSLGDRWWFPLYTLLELHDPLRAWWFLLLAVALWLQLLALALQRGPALWRATLQPQRQLTPALLSRAAVVRDLKFDERDRLKTAGRVVAAFRRQGFAPQQVAADGGAGAPGGELFFFAERGRLARAGGPLLVLGLMVAIAGGLADLLLGIDGQLELPVEGAAFDYIYCRTPSGAAYKQPLGFAVRIIGFVPGVPGGAETETSGEGETQVEVLGAAEAGRPVVVHRQTLKRKQPLRREGWTLAQSGFLAIPERDRVKLHVLDKSTAAHRDLTLERNEAVTLAAVSLKAVNYTPNLAELGPALQVERREGGKVTRFWVLQRYPDFDGDNRGDRYGLRFDGLVPFYVTSLRASRTPGRTVGLVGLALAFLGLGLAYATAHRRLWLRLGPGGQGQLAGIAHQYPRRFAGQCAALLAMLGAAPELGKRSTGKSGKA